MQPLCVDAYSRFSSVQWFQKHCCGGDQLAKHRQHSFAGRVFIAAPRSLSTMAEKAKSEAKSALSTFKPFINGGLSGMAATCIIQPVDMVKVRLQIGATGSPVSTRVKCSFQL